MSRLKRTRFAAVALWSPRLLFAGVMAQPPPEPGLAGPLPQQDTGPSAGRGQAAHTTAREPSRGPLRSPRRDAPDAPSGAMCSASSSCAPTFPGMALLLAALGCLCGLLFERLLEGQAVWRSARFARLRERPG